MTEEVVEPVVTDPGSAEPVVKEPIGDVRFKNDVLKFKNEAKVLRDENEALKQAGKDAEINKLKEKEDWKAASNEWETRALESEKKQKDNYDSFLEHEKRTAIEQEALKMGIKPAYLKFLHTESSSVEVETTSAGNVNVNGAKEHVEDFKSKYSEAFKGTSVPNISGANPQINPGKSYSAKSVLDLQKTDKTKYAEVMLKVRKGEIKLK